jgi:hypothetical protein
MAAPRIILRFLDNPCSYRIEMDVASQFFQVRICVYQNSFVPPLKEMARSFLAPIRPTGVAETEILHNSRKRNPTHLNRQVDMVGHQTKCMDTMPETFNSLLQ